MAALVITLSDSFRNIHQMVFILLREPGSLSMDGGSRSGFLQVGEYSAGINHYLVVATQYVGGRRPQKPGVTRLKTGASAGPLGPDRFGATLDDSLPFRLSIAASRVVFTT